MITLAKPVGHVLAGNLVTLRLKASQSRNCPLWRNTTRTVFGRGRPMLRLAFWIWPLALIAIPATAIASTRRRARSPHFPGRGVMARIRAACR
ncbi:hypothetical protein HFP05_00975 [Rhodanobacter denitrificans]|nr:hypothetical protein [Rhodanobacter denitrificans]